MRAHTCPHAHAHTHLHTRTRTRVHTHRARGAVGLGGAPGTRRKPAGERHVVLSPRPGLSGAVRGSRGRGDRCPSPAPARRPLCACLDGRIRSAARAPDRSGRKGTGLARPAVCAGSGQLRGLALGSKGLTVSESLHGRNPARPGAFWGRDRPRLGSVLGFALFAGQERTRLPNMWHVDNEMCTERGFKCFTTLNMKKKT